MLPTRNSRASHSHLSEPTETLEPPALDRAGLSRVRRTRGVSMNGSQPDEGGLRAEIAQRKPFHSPKAEIAVSVLRTAALIERYFAQIVARADITTQQYNVLRILRGAGAEGLPTLVIRDRMIHEAPGITRLIDKLEASGLARRERASPDRRQVFCYITERGIAVVTELEEAMRAADDVAVGDLTDAEQRELLRLLERVRDSHARTRGAG